MTDASEPREPDFVDKVLGAFDHLLDMVHDKVLRPIILAARFAAYGFIIAAVALVLVAVLVIGFVRLLNVYAFQGKDWLSYAVIGGLSFILGLYIWRRRRPLKLRK
jgi:phosphatidylglycerophosphate synthase